ncbi:MAG: cysteine synthase A [Bacillota bacterium]
MIYKTIYDTIGKTPVVQFRDGLMGNIYGKLEYFNPGGSVKDRAAHFMVEDLMKSGKIEKDSVLVEPTSGNTGIGIAMICSALGIRCVFTMPETMSVERQKILKAYGAELILTEGAKGMKGAIEKAKELAKKDSYFMLSQFENPHNVMAHQKTTALELIEDFKDIGLDVFVSGIGTGGTITGTAKVLKEHFPNIYIVGVEPMNSPFLTKGTTGPHKIQGIGAGFHPDILDLQYVDEIVALEDEFALEYARKSGKENGILLGISGGAAYKVATDMVKKMGADKNIVFMVPDNGERYLSTILYEV